MKDKDYVNAWDNRVGLRTSHISGHIDYQDLREMFYKPAVQGAKLNGKTVIDYGCGGGLFGKFLKSKKIKKYIGLDVSGRSLNEAKKLLGDSAVLMKIPPFEYPDIAALKADYLFCLNVIQHFPTKKYLDDWLKNINNSEVKNIVLQFREGPLFFQENPYKTTHEINMANTIPEDYIIMALPNYDFKMPDCKLGWVYGTLNESDKKLS